MVDQGIFQRNVSSLRGGICLCGLEFNPRAQWAFDMYSGVLIGWLSQHINTQLNDLHELDRYEQRSHVLLIS